MAVKEVCAAGYVTAQCRCMQEIHGGVTVKPCEHKSHDGMVKANDRALKAAGLLVEWPAQNTVEVAGPEWQPVAVITPVAHTSKSSGYDAGGQFWQCSCGWQVNVSVPADATPEQHKSAIDVTFGAFQAHKAAVNG